MQEKTLSRPIPFRSVPFRSVPSHSIPFRLDSWRTHDRQYNKIKHPEKKYISHKSLDQAFSNPSFCINSKTKYIKNVSCLYQHSLCLCAGTMLTFLLCQRRLCILIPHFYRPIYLSGYLSIYSAAWSLPPPPDNSWVSPCSCLCQYL